MSAAASIPPTPSPHPIGGWLGLGCGLLAALLFAGKAVLVRLGYAHGADVGSLIGLRMAISLPCFAAVAWWFARRGPPLARRDVVGLLLLGVLGYHAASWLDLAGLRFIDAPLERVVLFIYPTIVIAIGAWRGRTVIDARVIVALLATYGGILLTWGDRIRIEEGSAVGVALVAASAVLFAFYMVLGEGVIRRVGGVRATAVAMLGGCATAIVHALIVAPLPTWVPNRAVLACGIALAVLSTVIPVFLAGIALARLGSGPAALVGSVAPAATALISHVTLGERLGLLGWLGIASTTVGAVLVGTAKKAPPATPAVAIPKPG